jgi:restriction endonuclease Mrr
MMQRSAAMQIHCRNCGAALEMPDFHGTMPVTCPKCRWQETIPARRHLSETLEHRAGDAFAARERHRADVRELVARVAAMSPGRFDRFCAAMFAASGYEVSLADRTFDQSHALELRSGAEKVSVACTPGSHRVSVEDLEGLAGSMRHDHADRAIYVTTGTFDDACADFAAETGLELVDAEALVDWLTDAPLEQLGRWLDPAEITPTA